MKEHYKFRLIKTRDELEHALNLTNEYVSSFYNDNRIPNHGFDSITKEIQLLNIENTYLEVHGLKKIVAMSISVNAIIVFLKKFEEYYINLNQFASHIEVTKVLIEKVDGVVDRFGDIKDNATNLLFDLREYINKIKGKIKYLIWYTYASNMLVNYQRNNNFKL